MKMKLTANNSLDGVARRDLSKQYTSDRDRTRDGYPDFDWKRLPEGAQRTEITDINMSLRVLQRLERMRGGFRSTTGRLFALASRARHC